MAKLWIGVVIALVCSTGCKAYEKGFKDSFLKEFTTSCTKGATAQGANASAVQSMCGCMGKYLVDHNSSSQLTKMSANPNSPEFESMMKSATTACMPTAAGGPAPSAQ